MAESMVERVRDAMRQRAMERPVRQVGRAWLVDNAEEIEIGASVSVDTVAHWRFDSKHQADEFVAMEIARAAIEAMREPTEAMMEAADEPFHDELTKQRAYAMEHYGKPAYATGGFTERMWRAMITAALAEGEEG